MWVVLNVCKAIFLTRSHLQKNPFFVFCCAFSRVMENISGENHLKPSSQLHWAEVGLIPVYHNGRMSWWDRLEITNNGKSSVSSHSSWQDFLEQLQSFLTSYLELSGCYFLSYAARIWRYLDIFENCYIPSAYFFLFFKQRKFSLP